MARSEVARLQRTLAALEQRGARRSSDLFSLGAATVDACLGGGLAHAALHEFYAPQGTADAAAVSGFALGVSLRAAGARPLLWVQQHYVGIETGWLYGAGLSAFGLHPARLILVRARDPTAVLRAAAEATRCATIGAVVVEIWGAPRSLDLNASRHLDFAVRSSGVPLIMVRLGVQPAPSAAISRWSVASHASTALEANAPGHPTFNVRLLRHRAGMTGQWVLEWKRDLLTFADAAPLSRPVVSVPLSQPAAKGAGEGSSAVERFRRAG